MRASEPLRNVKTKSGGKQLLKRRPLLRGRRRLAKPAHSAIDPPGAEFLMGEIHIVRAEFSSAAGADVVIPRRKWQSSIAANWTDMHVQNLIRHETLKYSKFVDRLWVTPGTGPKYVRTSPLPLNTPNSSVAGGRRIEAHQIPLTSSIIQRRRTLWPSRNASALTS